MQGYQFGHIETWSRAGVAKQNGSTSKMRRNGQRGWTPNQVLDEGERVPSASEHAGLDRAEPTIWPGTCESFDELRDAHDEACAVKIPFPYVYKKTGKKTTRRRSVRKDTSTLYTAVISLPVTSEEARRDPEKMSECLRALRLAFDFERCRLEDAGGELSMAALHFDERQVHMHIYGLDRQRGSVNQLHPGKAAQDDFRARHGALSRTGTNLFETSKRAYCDAMREWQDDLHREALGKVGLMRVGPKRFRFSRAEYVRVKREEEERANAQETIRLATRMQGHLTAAAEAMEAREENVAEERRDIGVERTKLTARSDALAEKEQQCDAGLATIEAMAEGLLEQHEEADGRPTIRQTGTAGKHPLWPQFRKRLERAPQEVLRIGMKTTATLEQARKRATRLGREDARRSARDDLAKEFSGLNSVHAFARNLIARLRTPEERRQATEELRKATMAASRDLARLEREKPKVRGGDQQGA